MGPLLPGQPRAGPAPAGIASGLNNTYSRLGSLLAVPLMGLLISVVYSSQAPHSTLHPVCAKSGAGLPLLDDSAHETVRPLRRSRRSRHPFDRSLEAEVRLSAGVHVCAERTARRRPDPLCRVP